MNRHPSWAAQLLLKRWRYEMNPPRKRGTVERTSRESTYLLREIMGLINLFPTTFFYIWYHPNTTSFNTFTYPSTSSTVL